MLDKSIVFEEKFVDEEFETTTLYFIAPKEILNGKFPEADFATISVEFPTSNPRPEFSSVMYSPAVYEEENDAYEDYAWFDVELSYSEIAELLLIGGF